MNEKKIAIYMRVAQNEQNGNQDSLQEQKASCFAFAKEKYGENVKLELFVDNGVSGLAMKREGYQRLLKEIALGKVSVVIATEPARISRSLKQFYETLEKANIPYHFVNINDKHLPLFMWVHNLMLEELSQNIKQGLRHRSKKALTS